MIPGSIAVLVLGPITILLPRGMVVDVASEEAKAGGTVTPELTRAFADPAVALARRAELVLVTIVIGLMVLKPF